MKRSFLVFSFLSLLAISFGQGDDATNKRIIEIGTKQNGVMSLLEELSLKIGARLTSSDSLQNAMNWSMKKFKQYGCVNVHTEQWGEWPVGFQRGKKQSAKMTAPWKLDFEFTSPSWTPGTDGPMKGPAIAAPVTIEEFNAVKDKLKGAWMVSRTAPPRGSATAAPTELEAAIASSGILGRVYGSRNELVITSGSYNITWDKLPSMRRVMVRKSDIDNIFLAFDAKRPVELEIEMEQKFLPGPRKNAIVVAEILGTEKPDEVVIVGGHLDTWDGPGSQGALDNGTGTCVAIDAARILFMAKAKPKRTIRFILWTGEEQGLFGSRWYVEAHKAELSKISAVFIDDGGTNYQGGLTCTPEMEPMLKQAQAPLAGVFPELPFVIRTAARIPSGGGSDHAPFNAVGVPGFFWFETGRSDYNFVHHTQHDRVEKAIPEYLVQSSTNSAIMTYNLACAAKLLPRNPIPGSTGGGG